jgi:hypothetical protein
MTSHLPDRIRGPRRIAVLTVDPDLTVGLGPARDAGDAGDGADPHRPRPAEGEPAVPTDPVGEALAKLHNVVDEVVLVDRTPGDDAARRAAFTLLGRRLDAGQLSPDDLVVTLGASEGYDPGLLDELQRLAVRERLDGLLVRRDLSDGPSAHRLGHRALSRWADLWAGRTRLHDAACGDRIYRLAALADALDHCPADRPTGPAELAVVMSRLGCRVRNDVLVDVPPPGSRGQGLLDLLADAVAVPAAAFRTDGRHHPPAKVALRLAWPLTATAAVVVALPLLLVRAWRIGGRYRRRGGEMSP